MNFKQDHSHDDDDADQMSDINIVPLVDVMLVLLIVFMVTAPLSIGGIKVSLPSSKARSSGISEDRVVLSINRSGNYFLEKIQVNPGTLEARLRAIYAIREKKELYIRADKKVLYEKVVNAMSAAKVAGVSKISMLTEPPKKL